MNEKYKHLVIQCNKNTDLEYCNITGQFKNPEDAIEACNRLNAQNNGIGLYYTVCSICFEVE